ncbi:MAG TPA: SDR family oxidoreductase [Steroidobacteraceae bacterium]|nr:SDR family oxidoreductase [Steroidobacteraceae bacterium]
MSASSKTALITGSSSGIGFEVARGFLGGGWNVVLNGRNEARLKDAAKRLENAAAVATIAGSTSDPSTGEAMVRVARERFGSVDVLVNNAGEFAFKPFLDVTETDLEHYWSVNLKGTYLTTQAAVRGMVELGRGGSIVNVGTVLVDHAMSWVQASAPLISKGGVRALTIALAAELAPQGIRVNAVAPGFTRTPLLDGAPPEPLAAAAMLGRMGDVREISAAVRYLAESGFITGHVLNVDGGFVAGRR